MCGATFLETCDLKGGKTFKRPHKGNHYHRLMEFVVRILVKESQHISRAEWDLATRGLHTNILHEKLYV